MIRNSQSTKRTSACNKTDMRVFLVSILLGVVAAHPNYRDWFPNGYSVPNPCGSGTWGPVGHYDPTTHTAQKNPFGLHFSSQGHKWTDWLCKEDSDGDGVTNGGELGDPNCVWQYGMTPAGRATGHPGICEPIGSGPCANIAFSCGCHGNQCVG